MSSIPNKGTGIEFMLFGAAEACLSVPRFRVNVKALPGKPDMAFMGFKLAVFVDGCFWHGRAALRRAKVEPKSNRGYWKPKIAANMARDREADAALRRMGWKVLRLWEHDIKADLRRCVGEIVSVLDRQNV